MAVFSSLVRARHWLQGASVDRLTEARGRAELQPNEWSAAAAY